MLQLEHLDISANLLEHNHLVAFFLQAQEKNMLKSLNISFNNAKYLKGPTIQQHINSFEQAASDFMHKSDTLLHLDCSVMNLSFNQTHYLAKHGLRKARTLQSIHLTN